MQNMYMLYIWSGRKTIWTVYDLHKTKVLLANNAKVAKIQR